MAGSGNGGNFINKAKDGISGGISKARNRANNGKDFDVMNPEASNPNLSAAGKQAGKSATNGLKSLGKTIWKILKALVDALLSLRMGWNNNINYNNNYSCNCSI